MCCACKAISWKCNHRYSEKLVITDLQTHSPTRDFTRTPISPPAPNHDFTYTSSLYL